jgi:biopolymer transport protein ExbD
MRSDRDSKAAAEPATLFGPAAEAPAGEPLLLSWFSAPGSPGKLRAHYRPAGRFSHVALSVAPWFDALLLLVAFLAFHRATAVVPSETVSLPGAEFAAGARSSLVLVARADPNPRAGAEFAAEVFLDGVAYNLASPGRADEFRTDLAAAAARTAETGALVYMDEALSHGDAVRLSGILRDAGLERASFVTRQ